MDTDKIISPLDELVGYIRYTPLIINPQPGVSIIIVMNAIKDIGGRIKGVSFGNSLRTDLSLQSLKDLDKNKNIEKIRFDGDYRLLKGAFEQRDKFDKYLIELLSFLESTPIIIQTTDGLKEEDKSNVEKLGGKIKDNLSIINSFTATLSLNKIEELAKFSRIVHIWYDQPLFGFFKHGGEKQ